MPPDRERQSLSQDLAFYAAAVATSDDAVIGLTPDGVVTHWNTGAERLYGYPAEEMIGQAYTRVVPEERRAEFARKIERVRSGHRSVLLETERVRRDGERIPVSIRISQVWDSEGRPLDLCAITRDMTERLAADRHLREALALLDTLFGASPVGFAFFDTGLRYQRVNQAIAEINGVSIADHLGRTVPEVLPRQSPEVVASLRRVLETGIPEIEVEVTGETPAQPGVIRQWLVSYYPVNDASDTRIGVGAIAFEITERKAVEAALAQAYRYQVTLNRVSEAIRQARSPEQVQRIALDSLAEALGADRTLSILIDAERDLVRFVEEWRRPDLPSLIGDYPLSQFDVDLAEIFPAGRSFLIHDIDDGSVSAQTSSVLRAMNIHSLLDVPFIEEGRAVGVIGVYQTSPHRWTDEEIALTEAVASQLRVSLEASRLLAETQRRAEREALINRIGAALRSTTDPETLQEAAARLLGEALGADRCYYVTYETPVNRLTVGQDYHRPDLPPTAGRYEAAGFLPVIEEVFAQGTAVISDVTAQLTEAAAATFLAFQTRALLAVPIYDGGLLTTGLFVGMADRPREWTPDEVSLVQQVATVTRSSVETARIAQRERAIASQLQAALQPSLPVGVPGLSLADFYDPALEEAGIGGDFFDVFPADKGSTYLVVGDLSGKGLAAAAQLATVRNMLRYALYNGQSLAGPVTNLNRTLAANDLLSGFATLFVGRYDAASKSLIYVNCGQEPGLIRRAGGGLEELAATGPVLGMDIQAEYQEASVTLAAGDAFAVFTDGLTEIGPDRRRLLGVPGIRHLLESAPPGDAAGIVQHLMAGVNTYARDGSRDDICLLVGIAA